MLETLVLRIELDGTVVGLSGSGIEEALDLRSLGPMEVSRAGRIEFDADAQTWRWAHADGTPGHSGFATRREAVADEIQSMVATL